MDKKKIPKESGEITRREFLKDAGLVVGGAAIGSTVLLAACGPEVVTETVEVPMTFPASEGYLVVDSKKCCGCQSCMLACSLVNEGKENLSLARIQVIQDPFGQFPDGTNVWQCRQCVYPACVEACVLGALYVDEKGVRQIDASKCNGCKLCIDACPQEPHRTIWNHEKSKVVKCDLCAGATYWNEKGGLDGKQACVEVCSMDAIKLVRDIPSQVDNVGYDVNLRTGKWPLYRGD